MTKTILVTGVSGFVGHHLAREVKIQGFEVIGVGRDEAADEALSGTLAQYYQCDLVNQDEVDRLPLQDISAIINLAGLAAVGPSFDSPELYMRVNTSVLETLCKAVLDQDLHDIRIVSISSGAVYKAGQPMPLTESSELDSTSSPYAKSKIAMEDLAVTYRNKGVDCVVTRPFNHIGPGQGEGFLLPDLYKKVTAAQASGEPLLVGNLTTRRDYTDVRDVARAYVALATKEMLGGSLYNVCSGRSLSGEQILDLLLHSLGYQDMQPTVDEKLFRPSDAPDLYGDNSRIRADTGWSPGIDIRTTIDDYVRSMQ